MNELIGMVIGRLYVEEHLGRKNGRHFYRCICECGTETTTGRSNLLRKRAKSCGCLNRELASERMKKVQLLTRSHGMYKTRFYKIWTSMHSRCTSPDTNGYKNYGGRGIKVCDRWKQFDQFHTDMYEAYLKHAAEHGERNTTLDRLNVNGDYCKENCDWKTKSHQSRNKRQTKLYTYNGVTTDLLSLCELNGVNAGTVRSRLKYGWTIEDAITKPVETRFIQWMKRRTL